MANRDDPPPLDQGDQKRFRQGKTFVERCEGLPPFATWVNTTPHDVVFYDNDKEVVRVKANPLFAVRLREFVHEVGDIYLVEGCVPVIPAPTFVGLEKELPADGVPIIVSMPVAQYLHEKMPNRRWVFTPDSGTSSAVRDAKGAIVGVRRLNMWQ